MIEVHRLNGELFMLNSDLIETMESTPDTVVRLVNGHRYIVTEEFRDVRDAIIKFRRDAGYACVPFSIPDEEE